MQNVTVEMGAHSEDSFVRESRYGYGEAGGRINLEVVRGMRRERGTVSVLWNVSRGRGWLEKLEPEQSECGATAAFSAQVASMHRTL